MDKLDNDANDLTDEVIQGVNIAVFTFSGVVNVQSKGITVLQCGAQYTEKGSAGTPNPVHKPILLFVSNGHLEKSSRRGLA